MTPDGRVEGKEDDLVESLEHDAQVLQRLRSPKSSWSRSLKAFVCEKSQDQNLSNLSFL
jgi:hypothetical protein